MSELQPYRNDNAFLVHDVIDNENGLFLCDWHAQFYSVGYYVLPIFFLLFCKIVYVPQSANQAD